jgi:rfaE bifunctional protein nucleotidyltransferase chain/domain
MALATHLDGSHASDGAPAPSDKIRTIHELAAITQQLRATGKTVIQTHGTFDLVHLGHVRHLESARALGDVLIVTVTADRFVNKGPGRPIFGEGFRAEMLAGLHYVDWVAINDSPDAVSALELIGPAIYVKGREYENAQDDVTGKIALERDAVMARGGRIHFTDQVVFSSTELINRHFNQFEPQVRAHLDRLRASDALTELTALIDKVRDYRVVLVGDAIIDEYQYALPIGKPPKESVIAARLLNVECFAGGVFAAANHVASFCAEVDIITCLGALDGHEDLIRQSLKPNIRLHVVKRPGVSTTIKRRFVDPSCMRKLFEVCVMDDDPLPSEQQVEFDGLIARLAPKSDVVIVTDFGHGLIASSSIATLIASSRFLAVNAQSNSANMGYNLITKYPRADYICIDAPEARLAARDRVSPIDDIARGLCKTDIDCAKLIITHGKQGCVTYERGGEVQMLPALARKVVDTVGAGDAFLAVTAPLLAAGGPMGLIGFVGNVVGALKVEIVGHRQSIEKVDLIKGITGLLK